MNLEFEYRITYGTGQVFDRKGPYRIEVSKEEYMKIVVAVMNDIPLMNIEGIDEIIEKMTNYVKDIDGCYNMDGTLRRSQLKKPRVISDLEFSFCEREYCRIKMMKDPLEVFNRPKEQITVYRNDGSCVTIISENGLVKIFDSEVENSYKILEADHFISNIT